MKTAKRLNALERKLLAWTKARLRRDAYLLGPDFSGERPGNLKELDAAYEKAATELLPVGVKLLIRTRRAEREGGGGK